ncbi:MAG: arginine repressor [Clostridia bacterium]|nr:arginine repressor [Clostridia bacterium]
MKQNRHSKILEIIAQSDVETQEQLIELLKASGVSVTQATVSRDIKDLKLVKVASKNGAYKYAQTVNDSARPAAKFHNIMKETVTTVDHAENIVVIKTFPGMAGSAAAAIDSLHHPGIVGSIAGDDTIMLVMRTKEVAKVFAEEFYSYFKR